MCGEELGGRWLVVAAVGGRRWCRGNRKEVNRSDLFCMRFFFIIWDGMGGNGFASTFEVRA